MLLDGLYTRDMVYGGAYQIVGTTERMGIAAPVMINLFSRNTLRCIRRQYCTSGAFIFDLIAYSEDAYFVTAHDLSAFPLNAVILDRITPTLGDAEPWELPNLQGQTISGQALSQGGTPANVISFREWSTKRVRYNLVPEADGSWSVTLPAGQWDITYFVNGCAPVCHGPYLITGG